MTGWLSRIWVRYLTVFTVFSFLSWGWKQGKVQNGPVVCVFRLLTNHPCPMCGTTRATAAFCAGDIETALALNPFGLMFVVLGVVLWLSPPMWHQFKIWMIRAQSFPVIFWPTVVTMYSLIWIIRFD